MGFVSIFFVIVLAITVYICILTREVTFTVVSEQVFEEKKVFAFLKSGNVAETIIHCNPLVVNLEKDGNVYMIEDNVKFFGFDMKVKYNATILVRDDGYDSVTQAPLNTLLISHVTFEKSKEGVRAVEHTSIQAPNILASFTMTEASQAHLRMFRCLHEKI